MCEKPQSIGIIKNIYIPLMVINWWTINAKEEPIKANIIKNSLLVKYLKSLIMFLIITITRINKDKWISLKRKIILLNSKGNKNSILLSPNDNGNKIYCWKNKENGISVIFIVIKKIEIKDSNPKMTKSNFLIWKLKRKWIIDKIRMIRKIWPDGACLVKKAIPKIIGRKNQ